MSAKLQQISELENILSVKSSTNASILDLFSKFGMGRVLSRHALDKKRGVEYGPADSLADTVPD